MTVPTPSAVKTIWLTSERGRSCAGEFWRDLKVLQVKSRRQKGTGATGVASEGFGGMAAGQVIRLEKPGCGEPIEPLRFGFAREGVAALLDDIPP
jgi:hypothetical protein